MEPLLEFGTFAGLTRSNASGAGGRGVQSDKRRKLAKICGRVACRYAFTAARAAVDYAGALGLPKIQKVTCDATIE